MPWPLLKSELHHLLWKNQAFSSDYYDEIISQAVIISKTSDLYCLGEKNVLLVVISSNLHEFSCAFYFREEKTSIIYSSIVLSHFKCGRTFTNA
jgi:hypothetical protein